MNLHDLLQQWKKSYASVQVKLAPYITNVDDVIPHNIEQDNKIVIEGGSWVRYKLWNLPWSYKRHFLKHCKQWQALVLWTLRELLE